MLSMLQSNSHVANHSQPNGRLLVLKVLEVLKEAHDWLCKENEPEVRKTLEKRGWLAAYDLQPDVPFPERK